MNADEKNDKMYYDALDEIERLGSVIENNRRLAEIDGQRIIELKQALESVLKCAAFVDDAGNYAAAWHEKGTLEDHPIIKARKALEGGKK